MLDNEIFAHFSKEDQLEIHRLGQALQKDLPIVNYIVVDDSHIITLELPEDEDNKDVLRFANEWNFKTNIIPLDVCREFQYIKGKRVHVKEL